MLHRSLTALAVVLAVAGVAGCGSSPAKPVASGLTPDAAASHPASSAPAPGTPASPSASTGPSGRPSRPSASVTGTPASLSASPSDNWHATEAELPIDASVDPTCVLAGTSMTLTVHTEPKATLAYVAVYHGEKSGAAPPFGYGYGGNDKGQADANGDWHGSWTVTANAPTGSAYVLLVVGSQKYHKQRQVKVPFAVRSATGGCSG